MPLNSVLRVALLASLATANLLADVTYTKTVRYTGGTMLAFLRALVNNPMVQRLVGADMEAALEDQAYTVYVKGSKMAQLAGTGATIYDLEASTITTIDPDKQTYTVETFAELRAQIDRAQQWMKHAKTDPVLFTAAVENTGQTRSFQGRTATQSVITLTAQSQSAWGRPIITAHTWLVPVDPATRALYEFARRAAEKLGTVFTLIPAFFGAAADGSGTANVTPQQLNGISVLDHIAVTGVTNPLTSLFSNNRDRADTKPVISLEIESNNFSGAPIDPSKFAVPAGYREEKHR